MQWDLLIGNIMQVDNINALLLFLENIYDAGEKNIKTQ